MANYQNLKAAISAAIRTNGNQEITGQVLQNVLNSIVSVIGANYTFAGVATPATNPGTPDQNVIYLAMEGGTYTNFNGTVLPAGISLLMWNGSWTSETVMYGDGGVFDISVYKSSGGTLATYADLAAALDGGNNIPAAARKGGMSVKFVQTSDNKYVQARCTADEFTTDVTKWKGEYSVLKGSEIKDYIFKGNIGLDNKWKNLAEGSSRFYGLLIPIIGGHSYSLILTDELKRYAFLTDNTLEEEATPAYAGEESSYSIFSGNQLVVITAPSDATYLYVSATDSNGKYVEPVFIGDNYRNSYITDYNIMLVCDTLPTLSDNTLTFGSQTRIRVLTPKFRVMIAEKILSANTTFTLNTGVGLFLDLASLNLTTLNYGDYDATKGQMVFVLGNFRGFLFHSLSELFSKEYTDKKEIIKSQNYSDAEKKTARINIGISPIVKGTEFKDYIFDGNIAADNKWKNINTGDWFGLLIPIEANQSYSLLMTDNLKRYAFLQNNTITNESVPPYAGGASTYSTFSGNLLVSITAPADANYLYLSASDADHNYVEPLFIGGVYRSELLQNCYLSFLTNDTPSLINNILYFNNSNGFNIRVFCPYYRDEVAEVAIPSNHSVQLVSGKGLYIDLATLSLTVKDFSDPHTNNGQMVYIFANFRGILFKDMIDRIITKRIECLNRGKKIAVFGGSFSIIEESLKAKELWESILGCKVDSWGIEGSGFGKNTHHATEEQIAYSEALSHTRWTWVDDDSVTHEGEVSIQGQVEQACANNIEPYDIYILWASTNDFNTYPCEIGTRDSYTSVDNFNENARLTQCGGINYCIKKILEKNPTAQILFLGSMRFYSAEWGYNIYSDHRNIYNKTFKDYIDGQIACCEKFCIPYLDQWNMMDINEYNYSSFYKSDHTHMKNEGYVRAGYKQAAFISNGVDND